MPDHRQMGIELLSAFSEDLHSVFFQVSDDVVYLTNWYHLVIAGDTVITSECVLRIIEFCCFLVNKMLFPTIRIFLTTAEIQIEL